MGNSADRAWQLSQPVTGVFTAFNPSAWQPVLRRNKLRIFRFRASTKAQPLRFFLLSPRSRLLRGDPNYGRTLCVQTDWAAHGAFLVRRKLAASGTSRAPCAFPNLRCCLRCWLFSCLGLWSHPPYFPKEHQKERCGHFSVAALLHYFSWCASDYSVVDRISCHDSQDSIKINVFQCLFAEKAPLLLPLLDRIASTRNQYEDSGTSNLSKKTRSGS